MMSESFLTSGFEWINPKDFDSNKYSSNSSRGFDKEVDFEYPKESRELHNDHPLTPDKVGIKRNV